ncbi:MAG: efflux RND transporter periplasmic adaptor subunit [bacterium]|nr:efflux RND transporter periplasmic adaptor subunit [bacterium]
MKSRSIVLILCTAFFLAGIATCKKEKEQQELRPVFTMTVGGPASGTTRSFSGVSEAQKDIILSFRVGGQIINFPIRVGQQVKIGELLAQLDPKDAELTVSQKKAALVDTEAKLQEAKSDYERIRRLYESGSASASELDSALAKYRSARAFVDAARQDLGLAEQQLSYTTLKSEVNGEITSKVGEVFETVSPGQEVARMVTGDEMRILIGVPEGLVNYLSYQTEATAKFDAFPDKTFKAHIIEIGRSPTEETTYPVKLVLDDPDPGVRPGMVGEVTFHFKAGEGEGRILLPPQVVVGEGSERYVWVYDPKTHEVHKRDVEVGMLDAKGLVIRSGINTGEIVVTRGVHRLEEGEKVERKEDLKISQ